MCTVLFWTAALSRIIRSEGGSWPATLSESGSGSDQKWTGILASCAYYGNHIYLFLWTDWDPVRASAGSSDPISEAGSGPGSFSYSGSGSGQKLTGSVALSWKHIFPFFWPGSQELSLSSKININPKSCLYVVATTNFCPLRSKINIFFQGCWFFHFLEGKTPPNLWREFSNWQSSELAESNSFLFPSEDTSEISSEFWN